MFEEPLFIFIHIPKSGGTTMRYILRREYSEDEVYSIYPDPDSSFHTIEDLQHLSKNDREKIKILIGHIDYGLHKYFDREVVYGTMLREPVARAISWYFHITNLHPECYEMSVRDTINLKMIKFNDYQVRLLSGDRFAAPFGCVTQTMFEQAVENLEKDFGVVGLTERFDESLMIARDIFNIEFPVYAKENVSPRGESKGVLVPGDRELYEDLNRWDMELYRYAEKRLERDIAAIGSKEVERRVADLRRLNEAKVMTPSVIWHPKNASNGQ